MTKPFAIPPWIVDGRMIADSEGRLVLCFYCPCISCDNIRKMCMRVIRQTDDGPQVVWQINSRNGIIDGFGAVTFYGPGACNPPLITLNCNTNYGNEPPAVVVDLNANASAPSHQPIVPVRDVDYTYAPTFMLTLTDVDVSGLFWYPEGILDVVTLEFEEVSEDCAEILVPLGNCAPYNHNFDVMSVVGYGISGVRYFVNPENDPFPTPSVRMSADGMCSYTDTPTLYLPTYVYRRGGDCIYTGRILARIGGNYNGVYGGYACCLIQITASDTEWTAVINGTDSAGAFSLLFETDPIDMVPGDSFAYRNLYFSRSASNRDFCLLPSNSPQAHAPELRYGLTLIHSCSEVLGAEIPENLTVTLSSSCSVFDGAIITVYMHDIADFYASPRLGDPAFIYEYLFKYGGTASIPSGVPLDPNILIGVQLTSTTITVTITIGTVTVGACSDSITSSATIPGVGAITYSGTGTLTGSIYQPVALAASVYQVYGGSTDAVWSVPREPFNPFTNPWLPFSCPTFTLSATVTS